MFSPSTWAKKERKMLAHRDGHAAEIEGGLKTDLPSTHFHDDAVLMLQTCRSGSPAIATPAPTAVYVPTMHAAGSSHDLRHRQWPRQSCRRSIRRRLADTFY